MPSEPLFDVSGIDLTDCVMTRDQVARFLPHRGAVAMLDRLVWQDDDLNAGVDSLNKAYKEVDEGKIDAAQLHYDEANKRFAEAAEILQ